MVVEKFWKCLSFTGLSKVGRRTDGAVFSLKFGFQSSPSCGKRRIYLISGPAKWYALECQEFAPESWTICQRVHSSRHCTQALSLLKSLYVALHLLKPFSEI